MANLLSTEPIQDCSSSTVEEVCNKLTDLINELDGLTPSDLGAIEDGHTSPIVVSYDKANRPSPGTEGRILFQFDTQEIFRDDGQNWNKYSSVASVTNLGNPYMEVAVVAGGGGEHVFDIANNTQNGAANLNTVFSDTSNVEFHLEFDDGTDQYGDIVEVIDGTVEHSQLHEYLIDPAQNIQLRAVKTDSGEAVVGVSGTESRQLSNGDQRDEIFTVSTMNASITEDLSAINKDVVSFKTFINCEKVELLIDSDDSGSFDKTVLVDSLGGTFSEKNEVRVSEAQNMALKITKESSATGAIAIGQVM